MSDEERTGEPSAMSIARLFLIAPPSTLAQMGNAMSVSVAVE